MTTAYLEPKSLKEFCQSHSSFKTKFALLSFYKVNFSEWTNRLLLIWEYLQLMSQIVLSFQTKDNSSNGDDLFFKIIIYFFKLMNPSYLFTFEHVDSLTFTILIIIFWCVILKLMLFAYVICVSLGHTKKFSWLIELWRWVFKLQARGIYFLFTTFYVRALVASIEGFTPAPMGEAALIGISCFVILIEFLLSLMIEIQMGYFLPDKNFLASKNNGLQIVTLIQKLTLQMLFVIFRSSFETRAWVISCFSLAFNMIRGCYYYRFLPLYHFKALILQGSLLWIVICLNVAHFSETIRRSANNNEEGINFMITIWIILSALASKMAYEGLRMAMMKIVCTGTSYSSTPEVLIHKIIATKQLKKQEDHMTKFCDKYPLTQLVSQDQDIKFAEIFGVTTYEEITGISKEMKKNICLLYCEDLAGRFPENNLMRLYLAKTYFKSAEPQYTIIIKILSECLQNKWSEYYLTSSLLLYEVENSILSEVDKREGQKERLDLFTFVKNKLLVEKLQKGILKETEFYMDVCKDILGDVSDIGEIYNLAQLIGESKAAVQRLAERIFKDLPDSYTLPFLIYARYHLILNYSLLNFDKYMESFAQRYYKNERHFKALRLIQENLYQDSNALLLLSSQENDCGKILFCTKSFQYLCGDRQENNGYIGTRIFSLFPPTLRAYYDDLAHQKFSLIGSKKLFNLVHRGFIYQRSKYLTEVDFCFEYHPYLHQNLCFNMLIRPVPVREFLLIREDGTIEGASKEISQLLGLNEVSNNRLSLNIKLLSTELYEIYGAFKTMRKDNRAMEIYSDFTESGGKIQISSYQNEKSKRSKEIHEFYCSFEPVVEDGETFMTSLILQSTLNETDMAPRSKDFTKRKIQDGEEEASENIIIDERETDEIPEPLTSTRKLLFSPLQATPRSPLSLGELPLLSFQTETKPLYFKSSLAKIGGNGEIKSSRIDLDPLSDPRATNGDEKAQMNDFYQKDKIEKYLSSNSSQQLSASERANFKAFKAALSTKSYPKPFITLCLIFYAVIISTFVSQIVMKVICDKTLNNLQIKKDLLQAAEERAYRAILIQVNSLSAAYQINGSIETSGLLVNPAVTSATLQGHAVHLKQANDKMVELAYTLDEDIQRRLFASNVKMYGTFTDSLDSTYAVMNTFQATDELLTAIDAFSSVTYATLNTSGFNSAFYLVRNILDDLQYENQQIVQILEASMINEKNNYEFITVFCLIMTPLLLVGIGVLLTGITVSQYRIEKQQMQALIRVRSSGMKEISDCIKKFQKSLISEENNWLLNVNEDLATVISLQNEQATSGYSKQHDTRTIRYEKFRKRYYQYMIKIVIYLAPLIAINIWDWVSTTSANRIIYNRMDQLQYAEYIGNRVTMTYDAYCVLFDTNNTFRVEHKSAYDVVVELIAEMKTIQNELFERFRELDGSYNPRIKSIIYDNNPTCAGFPSGIDTINCENYRSVGQPNNMMATLTAFQNAMSVKPQAYLDMRSYASLSELIEETYVNLEIILPSFVITEVESQWIAEILDGELTDKMQETKGNRWGILVAFSLCLVMVSVLFWLHILKKIREVYNDFKKVLQIFPPGLILSSYLLKKFVMSTTNAENISERLG